MKIIFLICLLAGYVSTGFAQSSVEDVSENKVKPAHELMQPSISTVLEQKPLPKYAVQKPVIIADKDSSVYVEENKKPKATHKKDSTDSSINK